MIVTPLSDRGPAAIRDALLSRGWEGEVCRLTASGLETAAYHVSAVPSDTIEAMLPVAARLGLELVTGDDWILLAGARSRLGAFARPWVQPEPVRDLAMAIGMAMPTDPPTQWAHARGTLALDRPVLVGIVNVTPDSFSDGGALPDETALLGHAERLLADGATVLDVGGESTRPGAQPLEAAEEERRILPAITALAARFPGVPLSVDTVRAATADRALAAGAAIVNDVTAGRHDPALLEVAARHRAGVILCHSRGALGALASYDLTDYGGDPVGGVTRELADTTAAATAAGIGAERIVLDPGFGFAKTPSQNMALLDRLDALTALGRPVLVGLSRKRFLGDAAGREVGDRDRATAAACALAADRGARLFRVHEPAATRDALAIVEALRSDRA